MVFGFGKSAHKPHPAPAGVRRGRRHRADHPGRCTTSSSSSSSDGSDRSDGSDSEGGRSDKRAAATLHPAGAAAAVSAAPAVGPTPAPGTIADDERAWRGKLKPFFPTTLPLDFSGNIIGKCGTGKSFMVRWLCYALQYRYAMTYVFTGTKFNDFYQDFIDKENIFEGYDDVRMGYIIQKAQLIEEQDKAHGRRSEYRMLVILDDLFRDQNVIRASHNLKNLFTTYRHLHISVISLMQTKTNLNTYQREQSAFVAMFKTSSLRVKESLFDDYGDLLTKRNFMRMLDSTAVGRHVLVARPSRNSNIMSRAYEVSVATKTPPFRMPNIKYGAAADELELKALASSMPLPDEDQARKPKRTSK